MNAPLVGRITRLQRMRNSRSGNPIWLVTIAGHGVTHVLRTQPESQLGLMIENQEYQDHDVEFVVEDGKIKSAFPLPMT